MIRATIAATLVVMASAAPAVAAPPAYVIAELTPNDSVAYARDYASKVTPVVEAFGGRYLTRGGRVAVLDGVAPTARLIVIEFPSMAAAQKFWDSPEYRSLGEIRKRVATGRILMVEGVDAGH